MNRAPKLAVMMIALLCAGCGAGRDRGDDCPGENEERCDGVCVDVMSNPDHCGGCGNVCGTRRCSGGDCCLHATFPRTVDLLFVIDNSNSMTEEQASLADALPDFVRALSTGDLDGDGVEDFEPVPALDVGVVSTDMGTGGFRVPTCSEPDFGDDGILRTEGNRRFEGCMVTYPSFLTFRADVGDPVLFAGEVACVAQMGTGGCGFEQPLEAMLKALTPSTSPITFHDGTLGHGDRENAGFPGYRSVVAVVLLTDEDDCSAADPEIFDWETTRYPGELNLRCFDYPDALHPTARYVEGLLALREDPSLLIYGVVAGVPTDLVEDPDAVDYDAILGDGRMHETVDETDPRRLTPSCEVPERGLAFPPRRLVEVARQLDAAGAGTVVQSICQADLGPALRALAEAIGRAPGYYEACVVPL